jgi:arylsulfatase A-like enzyme
MLARWRDAEPAKAPVANTQYAPEKHREIRRNYSAMIENIDIQVGRLLDFLQTTGQIDDTFIVYASDHGDMLGDHDKWHKMMPEHPALSVPLIFAGPGIQPLAVIEQPVDLVDVAATLLDLAEVTVPVPLAGQVLTPWLRGGVVEPDIPFRTAGLGQWRALFDGRYKYIHNYSPAVRMGDIVTTPWNPAAGAPATLYDLYEDPEERINLAAAQPQQARRLRELLLENAG